MAIINRVGQKVVIYNPNNTTQVIYTRVDSLFFDYSTGESIIYWQGTFKTIDTTSWKARRPTLWESLTKY
jgi:hypothetical protein